MVGSTADVMEEATAENAVTLRQKLKNILTENFYVGSGSNDRGETEAALKRIDEATEILNYLRKEESKKLESDIASSSSSSSSPKVVVPNAFKCPLSNQIMLEPVTISSGQTYDSKCITDWLMASNRCPNTKTVLTRASMTKNHLVDNLITEWCQVNKFNRRYEELVTEVFADGIDSLLQRISNPSSVLDQTEAAEELRLQSKRFANVRGMFAGQLPDSINRLLNPLSALGEVVFTNIELQEKLVTALFNISVDEQNRTVIAENPLAISVLAKCLKKGTVHTKRGAASTLWSLSIIDSNKLIIGNSEALMALIGVIAQGELVATRAAASAIYNVCLVVENRERAVAFGLIHVLINQIRGGNADELLSVLALVSTNNNRVVEEMEDLNFIKFVLKILRLPSQPLTAENAVVIIFNMSNGRIRDMDRLRLLRGEEYKYESFTTVARLGTLLAVQKAEAILEWFRTIR